MADPTRVSQIVPLVGSGDNSALTVSQIIYVIGRRAGEAPTLTNSGGRWKLYRFDIKLTKEGTA